MKLKELVKQEGSIESALLWLVHHGVDISYGTLFRWVKTGRVSNAYKKILLSVGVEV